MAEYQDPLLVVWKQDPDLVKSLIQGNALDLTVEALKKAHKMGTALYVDIAIEILEFIVKDSYSQEE